MVQGLNGLSQEFQSNIGDRCTFISLIKEKFLFLPPCPGTEGPGASRKGGCRRGATEEK